MKPSVSRRKYFIKKELQGRFVLSFFLFVVIGSLVFAVILAFFSADTLTIVYDNHDLELGRTSVVLLKRILEAHWVFIVASGLIIVAGAILLTHRIAGPIYRFEQTLDEMTRGNIGLTTRLRRGDEGQELAAKINEFNSMLSTRLKEMRELTNRAETCVETAATNPGERGSQEDAEALAQARTAIKQLQEALDLFRLKNQ